MSNTEERVSVSLKMLHPLLLESGYIAQSAEVVCIEPQSCRGCDGQPENPLDRVNVDGMTRCSFVTDAEGLGLALSPGSVHQQARCRHKLSRSGCR